MKKVLKWSGIIVCTPIGLVGIIGGLFLNISAQFGAVANDEQVSAYEKTGHFAEGIFLNYEPIAMVIDCHSITQMTKEMFEPDPNIAPKQNIEVQKINPSTLLNKPDSLVRITWFGHSSFLLELEGKNILLDPVFGQYAAPHPLLGRKRYNAEMPIDIEELPQIDAIIISHDHYDHLDYPSIEKLKSKTNQFYVPLGVGNHLRSWGIEEDRIQEMDWWQESSLASIKIAFTPSRHMSGRGLSDQSATLWGSWVFLGSTQKIFFSGDGGYGKHFKKIGAKYGPFDIGLMECGQYNKLWADVHMQPNETVQAAIDVGAQKMMPIHWGSFTLSTHAWTEPVERVTKEAQKMNMPICTPEIGEPVILLEPVCPNSTWWELVQ